MNEDGVRVTQIDWFRTIPSLRFFDVISLAISPRVLLTVCALLAASTASHALLEKSRSTQELSETVLPLLRVSYTEVPNIFVSVNQSVTNMAIGNYSQVATGFMQLAWWMMLLGLFGVTVMRSSGSVFCTGAGCGIWNSVRNTARMWRSVGLSTFLFWILLWVVSVLFWFGTWLGANTHVAVATGAAMLHVLGWIVLWTAWLLSLAAIAIDRCDGAEALSRGLCYVLSRWLRVIAYVLVSAVLMEVSSLAVSWFTKNAFVLTMSALRPINPGSQVNSPILESFKFVSEAWRMSFIFCAISVAYVLLRTVEDGVSMKEMNGRATGT